MKEQETKMSESTVSFPSSSTDEKIREEQNSKKDALVVVSEDRGGEEEKEEEESSESEDYVHVSAPTPSSVAATIDFTKLSWKDKEAVLFELFRKIESSVLSE
jgi:hypothetical protein